MLWNFIPLVLGIFWYTLFAGLSDWRLGLIVAVWAILFIGINLLFVGRSFYEKGGLDALKTIDYLTKKYQNTRALVISKTPSEITERYSENKKIKFLHLVK